MASCNSWSQNDMDSLRGIIVRQKGDTAEVTALAHLANQHTNPDSAFKYVQNGLMLSDKLNYKKGKADCLFVLALLFSKQLNMTGAIQYGLTSLNIYEEIRDPDGIVTAHGLLEAAYRNIGDYQASLSHIFSALEVAEKNNAKGTFMFPGHRQTPLFFAEAAQTYLLKNQLDSALYYTTKSISFNELFNGSEWNFPVYLLATIQRNQGNYQSALTNYRKALPLAVKNEFFHDTLQIFSGMSVLFQKIGQLDSSIFYAGIVERSKDPNREMQNLVDAINTLRQTYKLKGDKDSVLKYTELSYALKDSLLSKEKDREIQSFSFKEKIKEQEFIAAQEKYKSKIQRYIFGTSLLCLLLIAGIIWGNYLKQRKAKNKIETAYKDLKTTQQQLIQSEKMASLGELTAGIAHEIQNPLNFVNNFSEINDELIKELQTEAEKGNLEDVKAIAKDIKENEEKINHHGKRADAIVKGMLQHSRSSSGQKEPTDINALCEEYVRLAYHGMRAKDKSFNAEVKTYLDSSLSADEAGIGKVNIMPQDIGRVILNLINNAFYAVDEKKRNTIDGYEPAVSVSTKKEKDKVEIKVKDNGNGIPQKVLDKIFQPFFTTKPTGQGTGLGLSLSYDIVKAHGGELKVDTKEGEGSEFIIQLPAN
jgi:signal transduction histidine kinase